MVMLRGSVSNLGLGTGHGSVAHGTTATGKERKKARKCSVCEAPPYQPCVGKPGVGKYANGYIRKMKTMHKER